MSIAVHFCLCNHMLRVFSSGLRAFRRYKHFTSLVGHTVGALVTRVTAFTSAARQAGHFSYTAPQRERLQRNLDLFMCRCDALLPYPPRWPPFNALCIVD